MAHIYSNNNVFLTFLWAKKSRPHSTGDGSFCYSILSRASRISRIIT